MRLHFRLACLLLIASTWGAAGDGRAEGPLAPPDTLKHFELPDGLAIELVAAEPLVVDPVAISFDEQGQMFVVEYRDYPNGPGEGKPPLSRIKLLVDTDGDGRMDQSHVFAEGLSFAQGVLAWRGGAIVTAAPDVLFLKDTDGDHKADVREVLFTGFKPGNPQLRTAHPKLGLDNWIYLTNGLSGGEITRPGHEGKLSLGKLDFRFHSKTLTFEPESGVGQFGNTFDDFGNRFFCSNRNPVMFALLPQKALARNPLAVITQIHEDVAPSGGEAKVYPLVEGKTTAMSHAGTHTAACGVHVFRGDALGEAYRGNVFVCEPTGSLVTRSILKPHGASFRAERAEPKRDFLASTDTWFRPVSLADGPDGALYVVDMYREVIEHPQYMPAGLAETLNLRAGDDRGRIYRVRAKDRAPRTFTPPKTPADKLALLSDPIGWRRDLGQRLLVEAQEADIAALVKLATTEGDPRPRLHALHTLEGIGKLDVVTLAACLQSTDDEVMRHAVMMAPRIANLSDAKVQEAILRGLQLRSAQPGNYPPQVMLQLLLAFGGEPESKVADLLNSGFSLGDPWQVRALLAGAANRSGELLTQIHRQRNLDANPTPTHQELVVSLASIAGARGDENELGQVLELVTSREDSVAWWQTAALTGLAQGLTRRQAPARRTTLAKLLDEPPKNLAPLAAKASGMLARTSRLATDAKLPVGDRAAAARLLGYLPFADAEPALHELLKGTQPLEVQLAAIDALRTGHVESSVVVLLAHWSGMSPGARSSAVDLLLSRPATTRPFLEAMKTGKVQPSVVALERRDVLVKHADAEIKALAIELFGGAVSANRKEVAEKYAAALVDKADSAKGREVFKRICFACHKVAGEGHDVGPDITDVRNKSRETLLYDILDPNRAVEPRWQNYAATTHDGRAVAGLLAGETQTAIVLKRAEGKQDTLARSEIDELESTGKSLMPEGMEKDITVDQMRDLLEFLKQRR